MDFTVQFAENNSALAVSFEENDTEVAAQYSELPLIQGPPGPQGPPGSDAAVTAENITAALGYTPASKYALDALFKLNKGQTYDVLEQESEAYSVDVPSGSHYVGVDMVGGQSEVIDGVIVSSQTDRFDVASADGTISQQIPTNFPVLNSAGSVYDYIDLNEGKLHQRVGVVDLGTLNWIVYPDGGVYGTLFAVINMRLSPIPNATHPNDIENIITNLPVDIAKYNAIISDNAKGIAMYTYNGISHLRLRDSKYTTLDQLKEAMNGVMLYYELAEEIITDIEIPTELTDWLTVEAGGSITFHNADEGKRLLIPNKLSFIRKLDEVTV